MAPNSLQRRLSALRAYFQWESTDTGQRRNPALAVQAPRKRRKLPGTLEADQVGVYLRADDNDPLQLRDLAMAELLYSSGLRLAELRAVNVRDIDRSQSLISVTGKGSKTRTVPVGRAAINANRRLPPPPTKPLKPGGRTGSVCEWSRQTHQRTLHTITDSAVGAAQRAGAGRAPAYASPFLCQPSSGIQW